MDDYIDLTNVKYKNGIGKKIDWVASIGSFINGSLNNIEYIIEIKDYNVHTQKCEVLINGKKEIISTDRLKNNSLYKELGLITKNYRYNIGDIIKNNKKEIIILDRKRKGSRKYYQFKCLKCGFNSSKSCYKNQIEISNYWWEEFGVKNNQCPCCGNDIVQVGINDIPTTDPWMIKYFQGGFDEAKKYTKGSTKKIFPICPECNRKKDKKISIYQIHKAKSIGCSCSDGKSYPNKFMFRFLEQTGMEFNSEFRCNYLDNTYIYDFYIPKFKLYIEMDGGLGHGKKVFPNGKRSIEDTIIVDIKKDEFANKNGQIIRIQSDISEKNYLKNEIQSSLDKYFDFNKIDWDECDKFATKNLVKVVCEFYKHSNNLSTKEISDYFHLCTTTVVDYLNKGNSFGWCIYNPKEKMREVSRKNGKKIRCKVICFDLKGNFINVFNGVVDASRKTGINQSNISACCNGRYKTAGGFIWKRLE